MSLKYFSAILGHFFGSGIRGTAKIFGHFGGISLGRHR